MPGFTTHYLFGINTYKNLKNDALKKIISDNRAAYSLGLQGPDIFFYYLPSYVVHENNIGSVAHIEDTNKFFRHLIESRSLFSDEKENLIAQAYILGFVGHYILDCTCHPYVYYRTHYLDKLQNGKGREYHGSHMNLETDIDTELLSFYKQKLPSAFRRDSTIDVTRLQRRTIATILYYVYSMTYPKLDIPYSTMLLAIRSMKLGTRLLHDPHGKKKVIARKMEAITTGYPLLSPMISSDYLRFYPDPLNVLHKKWRNPWDTSARHSSKDGLTSRDSFFDLMDNADKEYLHILPLLHRLFETPKHTDIEKCRLRRILNILGNNSYHSGLTIGD